MVASEFFNRPRQRDPRGLPEDLQRSLIKHVMAATFCDSDCAMRPASSITIRVITRPSKWFSRDVVSAFQYGAEASPRATPSPVFG